MEKHNYGSGLIGLDVKESRKQTRLRRNHYRTPFRQKGLFICLIVAASILGLFLLSGAR